MIAVVSAGCSSLLGIDDLRLADDARPADAPDDTADASCIGGGLLRVCPDPPPTSQLAVVVPLEIDTAADPSCVTMTSGTTEVCVIVHASIEIGAAASLRATGPRPLVLASMSSISVLGLLDASSILGKPPGAGADPASCLPFGVPAGTDGGNGGTFGGAGGDGGNGGPSAPPPAALTEIRGGCAGGRGGGSPNQMLGAGGGAVYLAARERIVIDGRINASGAGGDRGPGGFNGSGGGGGGAGGLFGLDAPAITGAGMRFANGGGGGGGSSPLVQAAPGSESPEAKIPGMGGNGNGSGGNGSSTDQLAGGRGGDGTSGGGGGGGAGAIYVRGTLTVTGAISPAPTMP